MERARSTLPIPVQPAGLFTPPYDYELRRTTHHIEGLKRLAVLVPEVHDPAIMKAARALTHDLDAQGRLERDPPLPACEV